ncbi:DUF1223 domain-containing protein [Cochlodiniinecator piscidefendens]|uniref:DUF1223 domain-containing protein n=1 Tax=Cochlodiniinecator piscidefendens TaxID=2715756 RepID=UPI00140D8C57|nr:DUF1223 domain-containing protein [Cochlodiniinecator piscidefendens]
MAKFIQKTMLSAVMAFGVGQNAAADGVVLELYTSQGCSSCPPADEIFLDYAERDDVIALALHVDYWDYLGWRDAFSDVAYSNRQRYIVQARGERTVYTPQAIIGGNDLLIGSNRRAVANSIERHAARENGVSLEIARSGNTVRLSTNIAAPSAGNYDVHVVRYTPYEEVSIRAGENRGRTISYANIVTSWETVNVWNGRNPLSLTADVSGNDPIVVILQEENYGSILAASRIR